MSKKIELSLSSGEMGRIFTISVPYTEDLPKDEFIDSMVDAIANMVRLHLENELDK